MQRKNIFLGISILLLTTSGLATKAPEVPAIQLSPQIQRALDWSGRTVTHSHTKDGMQVAEHNGGLQNVMFTRVSGDGSTEYFCTDNLESAQAWLGEPQKNTGQLPLLQQPSGGAKQ